MKKYIFREFAYTPKELKEIYFLVGEIFYLDDLQIKRPLGRVGFFKIILDVNYLINGYATGYFNEENLQPFEMNKPTYLRWLRKWRETHAYILIEKTKCKKENNVEGYRLLNKLENTLYNCREFNNLKRRILLENINNISPF